MAEQEQIKHLVRIANTDLDGTKATLYALRNIKGIGTMYAHAVCKAAGVDAAKKIGTLSDAEIKKIGDIVTSPLKYNIPIWMLNRKKDPETGQNKHVLTSELQFTVENDIKFMKKIKSYKGVRHSLGQPVRGQRTRSNFRKNKGKVMGVKKTKVGKKAGK
ncbi:MAG: 30S ribosomal protein S13 [Candidatus Woesearchaeota archaeon]